MPQLLVGQRLDLGLKGVDLRDWLLEPLDETIVGGAEQLAGEGAEHGDP